MQRAYFYKGGGTSEWREIEPDRNSIRHDGHVWARYLFRNGGKTLHVFAQIPWAKYNEAGVEQKDYFLGWPDGHFNVWSSLAFFEPDFLTTELGLGGNPLEPLNGTDSGPIGDLSGKFNGR